MIQNHLKEEVVPTEGGFPILREDSPWQGQKPALAASSQVILTPAAEASSADQALRTPGLTTGEITLLSCMCAPAYRECGHTPPPRPPPLLRDAETELGAAWGRGRGGAMTPVRPARPWSLTDTEAAHWQALPSLLPPFSSDWTKGWCAVWGGGHQAKQTC